MTYQGEVKGGVIVLEAGVHLAEGTVVRVEPVSSALSSDAEQPDTLFRMSKMAELASQFPENPALSSDGAAQHDHYLYGTPKQP
jgi:hypothetical protein